MSVHEEAENRTGREALTATSPLRSNRTKRENGRILPCAQNLFVQGPLATLAFGPQPAKSLLHGTVPLQLSEVEASFIFGAVLTQRLILLAVRQHRLAT